MSLWLLDKDLPQIIKLKPNLVASEISLPLKVRDPYLCAAGSFFFPGVGQVYCGRISRGLVFLIPAVLLTIPQTLISLSFYFNWSEPIWLTSWSALLGLASRLVDLVVRTIATYDAYRIAHAGTLVESEQSPWED